VFRLVLMVPLRFITPASRQLITLTGHRRVYELATVPSMYLAYRTSVNVTSLPASSTLNLTGTCCGSPSQIL
jgi:hypothetical protein